MWGFINATRAVLDHMIERGSGRIVSIGSDAGRIGEWREAVYSGTKAGVIAMSKAIAKEVGKHGITLNVVCPGFTPGDPEASGEDSIWQGEQGAQFDDEILKKVARSYPLRRLGTPEDIVGPVPAARLRPRVLHHRPDLVGERRLHDAVSLLIVVDMQEVVARDTLWHLPGVRDLLPRSSSSPTRSATTSPTAATSRPPTAATAHGSGSTRTGRSSTRTRATGT